MRARGTKSPPMSRSLEDAYTGPVANSVACRVNETPAHQWPIDVRVLVEVEKMLGPEYVAVRADHLPKLYAEAKGGR